MELIDEIGSDRLTAEQGLDAEVEAFYRRDHPKLWRSLLGYTGDPDLASDAESEALAQALRRGNALEDPAAWIWRTAFRVAAGLLADRSQGERPMADLPSRISLDHPIVDALSLLDGLPPQQRAIVALRYLADMRAVDIAVTLDTSPGNVRVQLHHAHQTLRSVWSES